MTPNDIIPASGESPNDGYSIGGPGYGYSEHLFGVFSRSENVIFQETTVHQTSHITWCSIILVTGSIFLESNSHGINNDFSRTDYTSHARRFRILRLFRYLADDFFVFTFFFSVSMNLFYESHELHLLLKIGLRTNIDDDDCRSLYNLNLTPVFFCMISGIRAEEKALFHVWADNFVSL